MRGLIAGSPAQAQLDQWAADPKALPDEDRATARIQIERALQQEADPTITPYKLDPNSCRLSELPTDLLNGLTKCFEISLHNNPLTDLKLDNPRIERVLARNNLIGRVELGSSMGCLTRATRRSRPRPTTSWSRPFSPCRQASGASSSSTSS